MALAAAAGGQPAFFVEWPVAAIALRSVDLACAPLLEAASRSQPLWSD